VSKKPESAKRSPLSMFAILYLSMIVPTMIIGPDMAAKHGYYPSLWEVAWVSVAWPIFLPAACADVWYAQQAAEQNPP